jgi:DNA polymerase-3 subunit gamma/tau
LTKYVNEGNIHESFKIISECIDKGKDINQFANDFIWHLRNLLIVKDLKEPVETLNITRSNFDKLKKESETISKDVLIYFIEELSKTTNIMKYDENRRVLLETAIIRLATPESNFLESAVMARLKKMEEAQSSGTYVKIDSKVDNTEKKEEKKEEPNKKITSMKLKEATFEEIKKVSESWQTIISSLDRYEKIWIEKSKPYPTSESGTGFIEVVTNDEMEYEILKKDNKLKKVEEDLKEATLKIIGKEIVYKIINKKDAKYDVEVAYELDAASDKIAMPIEDDD